MARVPNPIANDSRRLAEKAGFRKYKRLTFNGISARLLESYEDLALHCFAGAIKPSRPSAARSTRWSGLDHLAERSKIPHGQPPPPRRTGPSGNRRHLARSIFVREAFR